VKYCIIIPDGGADLPIESLGGPDEAGRTPLEAARLPNLARVAAMGRVGCAVTTPPGFEAGSDVCSMALLGYDPARYHTGRAPLEAAAIGIDPGLSDWIFRLNLVTTGDGAGRFPGDKMLDHSAGAITDGEARQLVADLVSHWKRTVPEAAAGFTLTPGVSYRNILVDSSGTDYRALRTTPPHAVPGQPWREHLPEGPGSERLRALMESGAAFLPGHEINQARVDAGLRPATMPWIWGQGTRPTMPPFESAYGLRGAMITAVDLLAGIAAYIGWDRLVVKGMTSYHDTDYAAQGRATCDALDQYDVVCCHVEAPDEASHQGDAATKLASLEAIDTHIVGPVLEKLRTLGEAGAEPGPGNAGWRLLVMPDHYTLVSTKKHDATPVPFVVAGTLIRSLVQRPFTEKAALESDLRIESGHELMEYFLYSALRHAPGRPRGGRS
jgi:2,3-bisphosphoglycerate-independent phosphoglycerate mutase